MSKKTGLILLKIRKLEDEIIALPEPFDTKGRKMLAEMMNLTTEFVNLTYKELTNPYAEFLEDVPAEMIITTVTTVTHIET